MSPVKTDTTCDKIELHNSEAQSESEQGVRSRDLQTIKAEQNQKLVVLNSARTAWISTFRSRARECDQLTEELQELEQESSLDIAKKTEQAQKTVQLATLKVQWKNADRLYFRHREQLVKEIRELEQEA